MKLFITFVFLPMILAAGEPKMEAKVLVDFSKIEEKSLGRVTNDRVMGGLSQGHVSKTDDSNVLFQGKLSLENNGGFSSWQIRKGEWDLSPFQGVAIKVKGDGRRYKVRLSTTETYRFSSVAFQASFDTKKGEWTTVRVPFSAFKASWRGRALDNLFDAAKVRSIGIILADKKEGPFAVEVSEISAWKESS